MLNGNVTGSAEDLGLTYYNPARLAFIEEPAIVLAGKAYQLINYDLEDVLGSEIDLSESNFNGVPSIFSGTFKLKKLPNHQFAYSFISRYRSNIELSYNSGVEEGLVIGNLTEISQSFTEIQFKNRLRDEWYGVSWAHKLNDKLSVGASLFGSIYELNGRGDILISGESDTGEVVSYVSRPSFKQKTYGMIVKLGAAYQLDSLSLGLNITTPFISFKNKADVDSEEFLSGISPEEDYFRVIDLNDLDSKRRTATSIAFGAGYPIGKSKLHMSVDWTAGISSYDRIELPEIPDDIRLDQTTFTEELKSVFNFGAGADIFISPSIRLLASFSSDYSATVTSPDLFDVVNQSDENVNLFGDFWHFGFGPDLTFKWGKITLGTTYSRSSVKLDDAPDIPDDGEPEPISITSAVGFERWRFIIGLEIPLITEKMKGLPIK